MTALASRVDAILAAYGAAPAVGPVGPVTSFTMPVHCRRCRHDRVIDPGVEVIAIDQPTGDTALTRVHTRCLRCRRPWTFTATCAPTQTAVAERLKRSAVA